MNWHNSVRAHYKNLMLDNEALNEDEYITTWYMHGSMDYAKSPWERLTNLQTFASQRSSQLDSATESFTNKENTS